MTTATDTITIRRSDLDHLVGLLTEAMSNAQRLEDAPNHATLLRGMNTKYVSAALAAATDISDEAN